MTNGYDMYCIETIRCLPQWNLGTEFASHFNMIINESIRMLLGNKQMAYAWNSMVMA